MTTIFIEATHWMSVHSVQVALALGQIQANSRQNPGELDAPRTRHAVPDRQVGFTHTFNLPDRASIDDDMLILHVRGAPGVSNDFVLLDEGMRAVAIDGPGPAVPRIFSICDGWSATSRTVN